MLLKFGVAAAGTAAVGVVMMGSGTAFATSTSDFVVNPRAVCDTSTGAPKAAITVTDKDASGAPADIVVRIRLADGRDVGGDLATAHIEHPTAAGVSVTLLVDWETGYQWNVRATGDGLDEALLSPLPISDDTVCSVPASSTPSATTPAGGAGAPSPTGSGSTSTSPSAPADAAPTMSAPSEPSASATATGGSTLAESGGGSDTGLITGAAAVVVLAGAGTLVALRRRTAAGRH
ncbi:LAETG motif-containing sortase-dependent surface protein [Streptomyces polygonati]|uniref:LAETG motif-containing sortase-dependent surface protein n=1 Tax=Streptomyces polygonati TaxID=1617087 RepID=A0ABV8HFH6_9ACTN